MARGQDTSKHPNRVVSREVRYTKPDGTTALKPNANSSAQDWDNYREAEQYYKKNKNKKQPEPFDPYLNTWA